MRTPAGQPTGQVMPVTAIVTCFVLSAFPAEVSSGAACGRSSAVVVGVFCTLLDGHDETVLIGFLKGPRDKMADTDPRFASRLTIGVVAPIERGVRLCKRVSE